MQALADRVVLAGHVGDVEFGADAVSAGDEKHLVAGRFKQSAEGADFADDPFGAG